MHSSGDQESNFGEKQNAFLLDQWRTNIKRLHGSSNQMLGLRLVFPVLCSSVGNSLSVVYDLKLVTEEIC